MRSFDESSIAAVPPSTGVFRLYAARGLIFIGIALDVRAALAQHRQGEHGDCTRRATSFAYQLTSDPVLIQRKWLAQHAAENGGKLPECNDARIPWPSPRRTP